MLTKFLLNGKEINLTGDNVKIKSNSFEMNENGITLLNGANIMNADGLYTNLQFLSAGKYPFSYGGRYSNLGFEMSYEKSTVVYVKNDLIIDVFIPENFVIKKATITLNHTVVNWSGYDEKTEQDYNEIGYARSIKCYKTTNNYLFSLTKGGDAYVHGLENIPEISGTFGINGFNPTNISEGIVEQVESNDIGKELKTGYQKIIIRTDEPIPNDIITASQKSGMAYAILNVYGYLKEI